MIDGSMFALLRERERASGRQAKQKWRISSAAAKRVQAGEERQRGTERDKEREREPRSRKV